MKNSKKAPIKSRLRRPGKSQKVDLSDIPETDAAFWADAELRLPQNKKGIFLRIDPEVLEWFKGKGKGYQTRINAILRRYVETQNR
jgi:uncharacterized protein (DUF4415 family)